MEFKDRLARRMTEKGLTATELTRLLGVSKATVSFWVNGTNGAKGKNLLALAKALDCSPDWLAYGEGSADRDRPKSEATILGPISAWDDSTPLDDDEVEIPLLKDVRVSGGPGVVAEDLDSGRCVRMGKSSLRERGVQFSNAICVTVSGNSMEPALPDGSTVGVNMHITTIKDGKVYVIKHDGELRVKQVYRLPGGGIRLRSFNRAEHADEDYTPTEMAEKDISILGKVFWSSAFWD